MNRKNIALAGIIILCTYFFITAFFLATGSQNWLIAFEIITMLSGIYLIFLIISLPFSKDASKKIYKTAAIIFITALMIITSISDSINLTVIQLLKDGINIPDYFQLGKFPSVITTLEYLAWGVFMGLAFLFSSFGVEKEQKLKPLKITLFVCAMLCILGFFGHLLNENLWYIAPMGYGIGALVICIQILLLEKHGLRDKAA